MIPVEKLAPYLAHDLEFYGASDVWKMIGVTSDGAIVLDNGLYRKIVEPDGIGVEYKPILRSFDDFRDCYRKDHLARSYGYEATHEAEAKYRVHMSQFYFERKLDVFGLIAEGLAEDANKITPKI